MLTSNLARLVFASYALCIFSALASPADAQVLAPAAVVSAEITPTGVQSMQVQRQSNATTSPLVRMQLPVRVGLGAVGAAGGAAVGLFTGLLLPHANCACDDPGLDNAIFGAALGSFVMSAFTAAAPGLGSSCSFGKRVAVGMVGAAVGALVGAKVTPLAAGGAATGWVAGSGIGSGVGSWLCRG